MCSPAGSSPDHPRREDETRCWPPSDCSEPVISDCNIRLTSRPSQRAPRWTQINCPPRCRSGRAGERGASVGRSASSWRLQTVKLVRGQKGCVWSRGRNLPSAQVGKTSALLEDRIHTGENSRGEEEEEEEEDVLCSLAGGELLLTLNGWGERRSACVVTILWLRPARERKQLQTDRCPDALDLKSRWRGRVRVITPERHQWIKKKCQMVVWATN